MRSDLVTQTIINFKVQEGACNSQNTLMFVKLVSRLRVISSSLQHLIKCKAIFVTYGFSIIESICITLKLGIMCVNTHTLKKMIFALCSISLIKMSSYNITLGKMVPT